MKLDGLTTTHFKRHLSAIYAIKELIEAQQIDNYEFMVDVLMSSYYGLDNILRDIEAFHREQFIQRAAKIQKEQI